MKKINLKVEFDMELEVPDHVKLVDNEDIGDTMLFVHGKLLRPQLEWMALSKIGDDESCEFEHISDELADELHDSIEFINKEDMSVTIIEDGDKRKRRSPKKRPVPELEQ